MSFDSPRILFFLLFYLILVPVVIARYRKRREDAALFTAAIPTKEREPLLRELKLRMIISDFFFLFFAGFLIVALAGPRWGQRIVADYRRGVDVILAFDLSRSMDVRDCPPYTDSSVLGAVMSAGADPRGAEISRLERGALIAADLSAALGDVRLGAVIGKGRGILAVPLTYDSETIFNFINTLNTGMISGSGTNLESIINTSFSSFQDAIPSRRAIILFSDGEAHTGAFQAAVENARKAGISLSAVGLGSDEGGFVPADAGGRGIDIDVSGIDVLSGVNAGGNASAYLLDENGRLIISARQSEALRSGAERTGGIYVNGSRNDAAAALTEYISSLSAESRLSGHRREANPRWRIFILGAIACFYGTKLMDIGHRKKSRSSTGRGNEDGGKGRKTPNHLLSIMLFLIVGLFGSCTQIQGKLYIMEGNFFNSRGFYSEAISSYLKALDYDEAVPYAEYGLGAAYFALEEGSVALDRYLDAEAGLADTGEDHQELRYRIQYNIGIIYFDMGEFDEAANAFKEALKIDSSRIDAKRNLELSLMTINRTNSPQASTAGEGSESGGGNPGAGNSVIFEYLRQKEQEQWRSREWTGETEQAEKDY